MTTTNITDLRKNIKSHLDIVSDDKETMIIHRSGQEDVVMIPISEYNSWKETLYLMSTKANKENLEKSIGEVENGELEVVNVEGLWK
jgi:antitoxin YefM